MLSRITNVQDLTDINHKRSCLEMSLCNQGGPRWASRCHTTMHDQVIMISGAHVHVRKHLLHCVCLSEEAHADASDAQDQQAPGVQPAAHAAAAAATG